MAAALRPIGLSPATAADTSRQHMKERASAPPSEELRAAQAFMARLRLDHARLSRVLREIEVQRARLRSHPELARPVIIEALRYLVHYQHRHHHPREDRLYVRLAAARFELRPELLGLEREHHGGARSSRELSTSLRRLSAAQLRGRAGQRFAHALQSYVDASRDHMRREERSVFYQEVEPLLSADQWQALADAVVPDDPVGDQSQLARRYPHLAAALAEPVHDVSAGTHAHAADAPPDRGAQSLEALKEGVQALADAYGELLHEGLDLWRTNATSLLRLAAPLATLRALPEVRRRNCDFAARCVVLPSRLTFECARQVMAPFLGNRWPLSRRPAAKRAAGTA
jgi:hemerythrin-like domain-containing protein